MNLSVKNKLFSLFVVVIVVSISVVSWFGFESAKKSYIDAAFLKNESEAKSIVNTINGILETIPNDVIYHSNFYALKRLFIWEGLKDKRKITYWKNIYISSLKDYLKNKELYYQIRVLDNKGNEKIVLKYDNKTHKVIQKSKLQNQSNKEYFKKAIKLKKGEFYISKMSLHREDGTIEKPFMPVVRYSSPVIDENGETKGIIVLNFSAKYILQIIDKARVLDEKLATQQFFLLNSDGYYLYSQNREKRWGFEFGNDENFKKDFPNVLEKFKNKQRDTFANDEKIYSLSKIYPHKADNKQRYWNLIVEIDKNSAFSSLDNFKILFFFLLFVVLGVGLYLVNFAVSKLMNPLAKVTSQLKALSLGEIKRDDIIYKANDEIGQIVNSVNIVLDSIQTTTNQAKAVARGDFSSEIKLLGKNDKLGVALTDMMKRLKEVTALALTLSKGDYDVDIVIKGNDDELGIAINNMVKYLKNIAQVTEAIASGEIYVQYSLISKDDKLGLAVLDMITYLQRVLKQAELISNGDYSKSIEAKSKNDELGLALVQMTKILRENSIKNKNEIFLSEGLSEFSDKLSGLVDNVELSKKAISIASRYLKASSGAVYQYDKEKEELQLIASYAFNTRDELSNKFKLGEGVVGQVALEREVIHLKNIKDDKFLVTSATTLSRPKEVYTFPIIHEGELLGVVEIMSFESFSKNDKNYLKRVSEIFATSLFTTKQNSKIKLLLEESQKAYEEMQVQSEELQESNTQMEEQQQQLTLQTQELNEKNENIQKAKDEIEKASAYKSEFLANMSHELRTPLNSIILLSKLLTQNQNKTLDESDIEKTSVIHKAGNELLLLINDILDLSKIESGKMEFEYTEISSSEVLSEMKGLFDELAKEKKLDFIIEDNLNTTFSTDKTKLAQVLKNLLSNAFKFTKEGSVTLSITPKESELSIIVKDTGIGIPNEKLALIFEAFKQVDGSISREFGGTGLGLSISKTIVDLMGGNIRVESVYGDGSSFIVNLPLKKGALIPHVKQSVEKKKELVKTPTFEEEEDLAFVEDELKNKNILIVDDDSRNIFALTSIIESMGGEVYSAFHGKEALELLREQKNIDLILIDIMMPVMDGLTTIKTIKKNSKYKKIPIIAVTAKIMPEDKQKCLDAGADDYLAKPVNHNALVSTVRAWIK